MKSTIRLLNLSVSLFALAIFASGCYTQLATTRDEDQTSDRSSYEASRSYDDADTVAARGISDFDEDVRGQYRAGFDFYYPSAWYWGAGFYGDPIYNLYGYPGYYGYPYNYYGYGYPGYYGYGNYGIFNPYYGYSGYPFVTYAATGSRRNQTRDAGYRRSGLTRNAGYSRGVTASVSSSPGVSPASRRAGTQGGGTVAPANRRSGSQVNRSATRNYTPQSSTRVPSATTPSGSSSPSARSTPSGGSRAPSSTPPRSSGTNRSRGYSDSPASGTYRNDGGSSRSGSSSPGSSRTSSPSYTPSYSPSHTPAPSSAPSSPAPSSGGSSGGNRSSGSTRTGRQ